MGMEDQAADDAQFSAGYDDKPTETPAKTKPQEKPEPEAKAAEVKEPVDPVKELMARFDKIEKSQGTLAGHIGGLQRSQKEIQAVLSTAQAAAKTTENGPSQAEVKEAASDPAEWASLKKEYPEWAAATEALINSRQSNFDVKAFEAAVDRKIEGKSAEMQERIIDSALGAFFPGWKKEVASDGFKAWFATQPDDVKALANSDDVGDSAQMLKLYDTFKKTPPATAKASAKPDTSAREKRLAAAVTPRGTGGHASSASEVDEFEAGYSGS